jgi:hypothetical protein
MQALETCVGADQTKAIKDASQQRIMQRIAQAGLGATGPAPRAEGGASELRRAITVEAANAMIQERNAVMAELSRLCATKKVQ